MALFLRGEKWDKSGPFTRIVKKTVKIMVLLQKKEINIVINVITENCKTNVDWFAGSRENEILIVVLNQYPNWRRVE